MVRSDKKKKVGREEPRCRGTVFKGALEEGRRRRGIYWFWRMNDLFNWWTKERVHSFEQSLQ